MAVLFRQYCSMAVLKYGGTFSAVPGTSFFCGTFSAVMQYSGTFSAFPGISYFGGSRYCQNMAVITASTGTAHHGGKITAGFFPRSTLEILRDENTPSLLVMY